MAFETLQKGSKGFGKEAKTNSVTVCKSPKSGGISLRISRDILKSLGEPHYAQIALGNGEHTGLVLIAPAAVKMNNYRIHYHGKIGAGTIGISPLRLGLPRHSFKTTECDYEITDDGVVFRIPDFSKLVPMAAE